MYNFRISAEEYFIGETFLASQRSNCIRRRCGAVLVKDGHVIATGYNGTPSGMKNCYEGGCERCNDGTPSGQGYDRCLCVHSEENCIAQCSRFGISSQNSTCYITMEPCFGCLRLMIQSGIKKIVYGESSKYENEESRQKLISVYNYSYFQPNGTGIIGPGGGNKAYKEDYRQCKTWKPVADAIANIGLVGQ